MCGRFVLIDLAEFVDLFPWIRNEGPYRVEYPPRYNIAPGQGIPVVVNDGHNDVGLAQWGLVPSWAKDVTIGRKLFNARAETLLEKPTFRALTRRKRCIIPASGFYEWRRDGRAKTPMYVRRQDGRPLAFAGLWDVWHSPDGSELPTCTIITTEPNELMQPIHDRMPAILDEAGMKRWLTSMYDAAAKPPLEVLRPFDAAELTAHPVGPSVNSPANDDPSLIEPAIGESLFG